MNYKLKISKVLLLAILDSQCINLSESYMIKEAINKDEEIDYLRLINLLLQSSTGRQFVKLWLREHVQRYIPFEIKLLYHIQQKDEAEYVDYVYKLMFNYITQIALIDNTMNPYDLNSFDKHLHYMITISTNSELDKIK